jgi:Zn-dependent peptidase ImmA (M78 family)
LPEIILSIPFFRTNKEEPPAYLSPELKDTVNILEQRQAWLKEYLIQKGYEPLAFVGSESTKSNVNNVAQKIRTILGLSNNWASEFTNWEITLRALIDKAEESGINVVENGVVGNNTRRKLNPFEFRGLVLVDEFAPFVFINGTDFNAAKMFTLAHELAHIWLGSSAAFDLSQLQPADEPVEQFCNKVAAELLVPEVSLISEWNKFKRQDNPYQAIARSFKVSEIVGARRLLDLELISKQQFFDYYKAYSTVVRRKKENDGGNFYATQAFRIGEQFARRVIQAAKEGSLLYREAYKLTGLNGKTFQEFEKRLLSE